MCGILGCSGFEKVQPEALESMAHRGPDDYGDYYDRENRVYLGHRRLSIIDLSRSGRQPMSSANKRFYITYNGEVYNYASIKEQFFQDHDFKSSTDTEVVLKTYQTFGNESPKYLRGMFAFAIYDRQRKELFLSRDRLGIKPLYYYYKDGKFAFASELSALKALSEVNLEVDPIGLDHYFNYGYIPAPLSAYKYIRKLPPANFLVYNIIKRQITSIEPYWKLKDCINSDQYTTESDWIEAIEDKINESIQIRLMSDVPLGAFLSGGIDSSLVVSQMARMVDQPVKTFTIGFDYEKYDERAFAKSVSEKYQTEHFVEVVKPNALEILPKIVQSFGEPFFDKSAIPTYYVSQMARKNVTVALSGDGGDEVFAGYTRYSRMHRYAYFNGIPVPLRKTISHLSKYLPKNIPGYGLLQRQAFNNIRLYQDMHSCFPSYELDLLYTEDFKRIINRAENNLYQKIVDENNGFAEDLITQLQFIDLNSYLPEDILTKVDRMSMLHSLETRVPLLDHELVALALSCPTSIRFKNKSLKYISKKILKNKVSQDVLDHKKQGFGVPLPVWFRGQLKSFMQDQIEKSKDEEFVNMNYINELFNLHQKDGRDFSKYLYTFLVYRYWKGLEN